MNYSFKKTRHYLFNSFIMLMLMLQSSLALADLSFSKVFSPSTIGIGSVTTITFTITEISGSSESDLAFTDNLPTTPANLIIASPANASTSCADGVVTATDGGATISLSGGKIGANQSCTVTVDVTAGTAGTYTNPAITLTSTANSTDSIAVNLSVVSTLPGFSKSFAPNSVPLGGQSTLTFTIDNSANASNLTTLKFTDTLPTGMVIASPANASTTCGTNTVPASLTATSESNVISLQVDGSFFYPAMTAGANCIVTVDVLATGTGVLNNISGDLLANGISSGKASDSLEVTAGQIVLTKSFSNDPIAPGGSATLDFTILNRDRDSSATAIAFSDDLTSLNPNLAGLTFSSILSNSCGGSISGASTTNISFSGGTIAAQSSCSISLSLTIPSGATPGSYVNTTSQISATIGGDGVVGNTASDTLYVEPSPLLTKEFLEAGTLNADPVINPGDNVVVRYTISNPSASSAATDLAFDDELTDGSSASPSSGLDTGFLPFSIVATLPANPVCGSGTLSLTSFGTDRQGIRLTGGDLATAGASGDSCSFDVTLTVPADMSPGIKQDATAEIFATIDGATRTGSRASDTLTVISAPGLSKAFTDDPVAPGGTVTLEFTLSYPADASGDATAIGFTDDLAATVAGLTATGLPITQACDPDGTGGNPGTGTLTGSVGDTFLTFTDGVLSPGESCTISITLDVPVVAPGAYTNSTSGVSATVSSQAATSTAATDTLNITGLVFSKEFIGDPAIPGETISLRFTIDNIHPSDDATITSFTDNLTSTLSSLAATGAPSVDTCGGTLSGTTSLTYNGGSVLSGQSCNIEVDVLVPIGASDGSYNNVTSNLSANQGGAVSIAPARDILTVNSTLLQLTKSFTNDPVAAGDTLTLEYNLSNLDSGQAASAIGFTDNYADALTGMTLDSVTTDSCGATIAGVGGSSIDISNVSLAAAASCKIIVSLSVPGSTASNTYTSTSSALSGTIGGLTVRGDSASDSFQVVELLQFSKSFTSATTATGSTTLSFTITNPGTNTATNIAFTDNLNDVIPGMVATSLPAVPCGDGSSITGVSTLVFANGQLAATGGTCTFNVTVQVPVSATAGTYPNVTSNLTRAGLTVANPATANIVIEPAPTFSKAFTANTVQLGQSSTLSFTIDNSASALTATNLAFSDNLPTGLSIASPANSSNNCGGTLTAVAGSSTISLASATVAAGSSCTIQVDVITSAMGTLVNTTGDLSSSSGNSGTASATLQVNNASVPAFGKSFSPTSIQLSQTSTLSFTIDNRSAAVSATSLAFTDNLPSGMSISSSPNSSNTCGGSLTAIAGNSVISLSSGTVAAGSTCIVRVDVTGSAVGNLVNTTGDLSSSLGNSGTASATLTVNTSATYTAPTATGTGNASVEIIGAGSNCNFTSHEWVLPSESLAGHELPHGLFQFTAGPDCSGSTTLQYTFPATLDEETKFWKYGPTTTNSTPHWYQIPATRVGNQLTITITDGGLGDSDLLVNNSISDPGGPAVVTAKEIPSSNLQVLLILISLLAISGITFIRLKL